MTDTSLRVENQQLENISIASLEQFTLFRHRLHSGKITPPEIISAFHSLVSNLDAIAVEMGKLTKKEILAHWATSYNSRESDKKSSLVGDGMRKLLTLFVAPTASGGFSYSIMEKYEVVVEKQLHRWTPETIQLLLEQQAERTKERQAYIQSISKMLTNPETLDEFQGFINHKGIEKLSPEQLQTYEMLKARDTQEKIERENIRKLTLDTSVIALPEGITLLEVQKTTHTKTGEPLWVVQLSGRVERELYQQLNRVAKIHGGWYSSYTHHGAIPGWQFKDEADAEAFQLLENKSGEERLKAKQQRRENKAQEHLSELLENIRGEAQGVIDAERKVNTLRRAAIASSMEASAFKRLQLADTMENICKALADESLQFIRRLYFGTDFELLEGLARSAKFKKCQKLSYTTRHEEWHQEPCGDDMQYIEFPKLSVHISSLIDVCDEYIRTPGIMLLAQKFKKMADIHKYSPETYAINIPFRFWDDFKKFVAKVKRSPRLIRSNTLKYRVERIEEPLTVINTLHRLEIYNTEQMRVALREYVLYRGDLSEIDPLTKMRRELIGVDFKQNEYFPTPPHIVDMMIEYAQLRDGLSILEPSAGSGHIVEIVRDRFDVDITTVEVSHRLQNILDMSGYKVVRDDFLSSEVFPVDAEDNRERFDRVLANPPFSECDRHIYKMYEVLKPGGILVSVASETLFFAQYQRCENFRNWLKAMGGSSVKLEENSFLQSDNPTGVNTRLVIIRKPAK